MAAAGQNHFHAIVWIDHAEAKIFYVNASEATKATLHAAQPRKHLHHKAGEIGAGRAPEDRTYLAKVADMVANAGAILITGPGTEKTELEHYLRQHTPSSAAHIVGVEPLDHPTDGELVAYARKYFRAADRMTAQR